MAVSKSVMKAVQCPTFYAAYYLDTTNPARLLESPWARTGTEFHLYRSSYVDHLVSQSVVQDHDWIRQYLATSVISSDARKLIENDFGFAIDPDRVVAAELFLSVDQQFRALEQLTGQKPGTRSKAPGALLSGTIDLLEVDRREAVVTDWKSGWSTATVSDFEPPVYAALVMAHFPQIERVRFVWEFARVAKVKDAEYSREDLGWMQDMIRGEYLREQQVRAAYEAGEELAVNPWAGMCAFCQLDCSLRVEASNTPDLLIGPIQTLDDARQAAKILYAAEQVAASARAALRPFLDLSGPVELGPDHILEIATGSKVEYSLPATLAVLGIHFDLDKLPRATKGPNKGKPVTPLFDIPIASLTIGASALNNFASAKFRRGLPEALAAIARVAPRSSVRIRRLQEEDRHLIAAGDEAA